MCRVLGGKQKTGKAQPAAERASASSPVTVEEGEAQPCPALPGGQVHGSLYPRAAKRQEGDQIEPADPNAATQTPLHPQSHHGLRTYHSLWPPRHGGLCPQSAVVSAAPGVICYYPPSALPACVHSSVMSLTLLGNV